MKGMLQTDFPLLIISQDNLYIKRITALYIIFKLPNYGHIVLITFKCYLKIIKKNTSII